MITYQELGKQTLSTGKFLTLTFFIIISIWYIRKIIQSTIKRFESENKIDPTLARALQQFLFIFLYIIGTILLLDNLNFELSNVLKTVGIIIVGLGVAAQQILASALAGIFLLIYKSFAIGDYIVCQKPQFQGRIIDINLRTTTLDDNGDLVIIPNQTLYSATITIKKNL